MPQKGYYTREIVCAAQLMKEALLRQFNFMEYKKAKEIAISICCKLQPYCERINIAGGLRRRKPDVHDIEIISLPKKEEIVSGLFQDTKQIVRSRDFVSIVKSLGVTKKGTPEGKMMQIELPEKIMLDLFIADEINYGNIYLIRTGDMEFSKHFMGVILPRMGYASEGGYVKKAGQIISTPEEADIFSLCKMKVIEPQNRNLSVLKKSFKWN